jgi:uncharacterized protein involved in exopolysaccharide biosynthesis
MNQFDNKFDNSLDDYIDISKIYKILLSGKYIIISITGIFAILSLLIALNLPNYYKSEALLHPRSSSNISGLSQYSGIAAMAGVTLPSATDNKSTKAIELIKSRNFVKHLISFDNILPSILASKKFNVSNGELIFNDKVYNSISKKWVRKQVGNRPVTPSYLEAHESYMKMININQDKITGFIYISVEHISPVFAQNFLDLIIQESNHIIRKKELEESASGINYLTSEFANTSFVEIRESISSLIEMQLETQMVAQINQDYVLVEIEPPFTPEIKSRPTRSILCILITAIGGLLGIFIVLARHYFFRKSNKDEQYS